MCNGIYKLLPEKRSEVKVTAEKLEECQVALNIEVEPEELERSLDQAYRHLVHKVNIPGFRKGKAPRPLLERYIGREALLNEALDHLFPELYQQAIEEQGVEPIAQPQVELTQLDPAIFKVVAPTTPIVELGDYHQLRLSSEPVEITAEQVDEALQNLRRSQAFWEPVEREVRLDDLVTISVEGHVEDKVVLSVKEQLYYLSANQSFPAPGFAQKLQGMVKGEEREFGLTLPSDYPNTEFAGKECLFKVSISEIKGEKLPELDDEFAKSLGQGVESVEQLRERLATELETKAKAAASRKLEEEIMDAVSGLSHIEYPSILVEQELERILAEQGERLKLSGKTEEEFRSELRPLAEKVVVRSLVLSKVRELENVEISDAEIDAEVERLAQSTGQNAEQVRSLFSSPQGREVLRSRLLTTKTIERLVSIATATPAEAD
jgi:trigger factor